MSSVSFTHREEGGRNRGKKDKGNKQHTKNTGGGGREYIIRSNKINKQSDSLNCNQCEMGEPQIIRKKVCVVTENS